MVVDTQKYLNNSDKTYEKMIKIPKNENQITIREIYQKRNGYINPVIVTFQNGELNEKLASRFKVDFTSKINGTNIEVEAPYGHIFKDSKCNSNFGNREILAIKNKKTNKIKLVEVDSIVLINRALLSETEKIVSNTDYGKEMRVLNKIFGGKKIVNKLEQKEKLNINSMFIEDEIKETVADITVEEITSVSNTETESMTFLLPPCHRDAQSLSEVYLLNEMLTEVELQALKEEVINLEMEKKNFNPKAFSNFFIICYEDAKKYDENLENRLAGLLFVETLLRFLKIPSKKLMSKKLVVCSFSSIIHAKLLNEFCVKAETSVTRPMTMRDKTLCYIITICLICCNYQINLKSLATVTSIHLNRLARLARVVGAVPNVKDEHVFVLKFPLPALPKSSKGKVQRK